MKCSLKSIIKITSGVLPLLRTFLPGALTPRSFIGRDPRVNSRAKLWMKFWAKCQSSSSGKLFPTPHWNESNFYLSSFLMPNVSYVCRSKLLIMSQLLFPQNRKQQIKSSTRWGSGSCAPWGGWSLQDACDWRGATSATVSAVWQSVSYFRASRMFWLCGSVWLHNF